MGENTERKVILVIRHTRLDDLLVRFNTRDQARFYIEHLGGDFSDYVREDERYRQARAAAEEALRRVGRVQVVDRAFLPNFLFGQGDTVVVLGQDGLVVNTAKYLNGQPILGVNPDPDRWDGVLLPFRVGDLAKVMPETLAGRRAARQVTMAMATLNNGQRLYAVNDLFIGPKSHISARYEIRVGKSAERQSSSGIIVSTGVGSTGWLRSLVAGARGLVGGSGRGADPAFVWDANYLVYTVREPFPCKTTGTTLVHGKVTPQAPLLLRSLMPENGVIFSDGMESDFLEFNSGAEATIAVADKQVHMVV
jgi:NAD kinase